MDFSTLSQSIQSSLGNNIPQLLGALAILLLGWFAAVLVRAGVRRGLGALGLNSHFERLTGVKLNLEKVLALAAFWAVLLLALAGVFNSLQLAMLSGSFAALTSQLFAYAPRLLAGLLIALLAWLIAALVRAGINRALNATTLDEKLSQHAGMSPISKNLGQAVFWLIILLFIPAILNALEMEGMLEPLRAMVGKTLDILPNVFAAFIIAAVGTVLAQVLRSVVTGLLQTAGADRLGGKAGLAKNVQLSRLAGLLVFIAVLVPALIAALDALKIEAVSRPATEMLNTLMQSVPHIIAATLILVIAWAVANLATGLLTSLLANVGFDNLPAKIGLGHTFEKVPASKVAGKIALFFAMLFATVEAAGQLGFSKVTELLATFIQFGADVLLGSAIFVIGFWLANLAYDAISRAGGGVLAKVGRLAILALVIAMGLRAMGVADDIVNLAFTFTFGAVAVAIALSFGLGGREAAGKLMSYWLEKFQGSSKGKATDKDNAA